MAHWLNGACLVVVLVGGSSPAGAEYRKTPAGRFDISELHSEFKAAGVNLQGASCHEDVGTVVCEKMVGDFTAAEKATMDAAVASHDPEVRKKRQDKQKADAQAVTTTLKTLGLTEEQVEAFRKGR